MARKPYPTTLKPETIEVVRKIQAADKMNPSVPQVLHASVLDYAKKQGVVADSIA